MQMEKHRCWWHRAVLCHNLDPEDTTLPSSFRPLHTDGEIEVHFAPSSVRWAFPHYVPVRRGGQVRCAWAGRSGLKACAYTCAQRYASVCVCFSFVLHITKVTRVDGMAYPWFTCDAQRLHLFSCGTGLVGTGCQPEAILL